MKKKYNKGNSKPIQKNIKDHPWRCTALSKRPEIFLPDQW